jgi:hypothetical protein
MWRVRRQSVRLHCISPHRHSAECEQQLMRKAEVDRFSAEVGEKSKTHVAHFHQLSHNRV